MLVNIYLKDGNVIRECYLYPEDVKNGEMPFNNKIDIELALIKIPWGKKYISFQTSSMHGVVHVNNVDKYEIVNKDFK